MIRVSLLYAAKTMDVEASRVEIDSADGVMRIYTDGGMIPWQPCCPALLRSVVSYRHDPLFADADVKRIVCWSMTVPYRFHFITRNPDGTMAVIDVPHKHYAP